MATEAEIVGKPFTLRFTAERLELAERIRKIIPGQPKPRSAEFFFGLMELVTYTLLFERKKNIQKIRDICGKWKIDADDIGFENDKVA